MKLTDSQIERYIILAEECSEVIKVVSKIIRFGEDEGKTAMLEQEIGDVLCATALLEQNKDVNSVCIHTHAIRKVEKLNKYMKHNKIVVDKP